MTENQTIHSVADANGGVYITYITSGGTLWIYYCKDGSISDGVHR